MNVKWCRRQKPTFRHEIFVNGTCFSQNNPISKIIFQLTNSKIIPNNITNTSNLFHPFSLLSDKNVLYNNFNLFCYCVNNPHIFRFFSLIFQLVSMMEFFVIFFDFSIFFSSPISDVFFHFFSFFPCKFLTINN